MVEEVPKKSKPAPPSFLKWLPWEKATIWGLFLLTVYTLRHFFFIIFMTFVLSYFMRSVVLTLSRRISPDKPKPWLERALAVVCFIVLLFVAYGVGSFFGPKLLDQGEALVNRLKRMEPQREFNQFLATTVGDYLFNQEYPSRADPRYVENFERFKQGGAQYFREYRDFFQQLKEIEDPFDEQFAQRHGASIRAQVDRLDASGKEFDEWLLTKKAPEVFKTSDAERAKMTSAIERLLTSSRNAEAPDAMPKSPESANDKVLISFLLGVIKESGRLAEHELEWKNELVEKRLAELRNSPDHQKEFEDYYKSQSKLDPERFRYEYDVYRRLKAAYFSGEKAFVAVLVKEFGDEANQNRRIDQLHEDFKAKTQSDLAQKWWQESAIASAVKRHLSEAFDGVGGTAAAWVRSALTMLITIPVQLALSLLLSFFITFDLPNLSRGIRRLRESRLSDFYEEISPGLINFARLMGRAFEAQAVIALCNMILTLIAIRLLGIQNEIFLCAIVFLCSFIPVLGVVFSSIPIAVMALIQQPDGSIWKAVLAVVAILIIHFIETSLLNPKIIGDMLHLHPVVVLAVLAVGEHFFGVWGLLLGVPVTVYIFRFVILNEGIPGFIEPVTAPSASPIVTPTTASAPAIDAPAQGAAPSA